MGCVSSKEAKLEAVANANGDNKKPDNDNKNASPEAPAATTTSEPPPPKSTPNCHDNNTNSTCTHEVACHGSLGTFQYACWSKQGKDPDCTDKPNQDSFSVTEKFVQQNGDLFWGVYDGHGKTGAECSQFVRDRLPPLIAKYLEEDHFDLILSTEQIHSSLKKAHLEVNRQLHDATDIDDAYSGTTSISVYLQGSASRITISNVGDSRAILGTQLPNNNNPQNNNNNNKLMPIPLSKDQTPRRAEEAQRCKQAGARILSFGQINGDQDDDDDEEDPPRVWAATGHYPGTAFTRSLGDHIAEKLGVSAEPEIMSLKLTENEKVVVLATDGIFDVLSNQEILDLCQAHNHDPLAACRAIVAKSHEEWLQNEDCEADCDPRASYDDMTLICIFLHKFWEQANNNNNKTEPAAEPQPEAGKKRRVRQKTLRNLEEMGGGEEQ